MPNAIPSGSEIFTVELPLTTTLLAANNGVVVLVMLINSSVLPAASVRLEIEAELVVTLLTLNVAPAVVHQGQALYNSNCMTCHGFNVVAGPIPDLRYASKEVHDQFEQIVLGGTREMLGMPSFKKILNGEQLRAIQAYVLSRAAESSKAAEPSGGSK